MRVGVLLSPDPAGTDIAGCFDRLIATARHAERLGYSSVWIGERHFSRDRPEPVPLVFAGALAAETDSIALGIMVKLVLEHPLKIAEDAAVLDLMSGGRLLFGVDPGAGGDETAGYGVASAERRSCFTEALDIIVNAWTSDGFAYRGKHHTLPAKTNAVTAGSAYVAEPHTSPYVEPWQRVDQAFDYLSVLPKPAQIPHPPIFVVANDDDSMALAAAKGYSPLVADGATAGQIAARAAAFWQALAAAGRDRSETVFTIARGVALDSTHSDAVGVDETLIAGTPAAVVDRIKQLQHETGLGQILCRFDLPGVTPEQADRSLARFAAEVRPRLEM